MIEFLSGDMFGTQATHRVNTVNCVGVMGASVALLFKRRFPAMFDAYRSACEAGTVQPGTLHLFQAPTCTILNFPTKRHWQSDSRYEDIEAGLLALRNYLRTQPAHARVTIPALGCGHGGLNWERVKLMILDALANLDADIFVFAPTKWVTNWFSNMLLLDQPFVYQGIRFATVENFYQAMKLAKDNAAGRQAIAAMQPHAAKRAIRDKAQFPWRDDWNQELSLQVMEFALRKKFAPNTTWATKLLATGHEEIVEWNNWGDTFWGQDLRSGEGQNHLGKLLMKIRADLPSA